MKRITVEQIAKVCHEANRAYCDALGDFSQTEWDVAPQWQRDSAAQGVRSVLRLVEEAGGMERRLTGPKLVDRDFAEQIHRDWARAKVADGWRYGEVKDAGAKTHPCLVQYTDLPPEQQAKDILFVSIVRALRHRLEVDFVALLDAETQA